MSTGPNYLFENGMIKPEDAIAPFRKVVIEEMQQRYPKANGYTIQYNYWHKTKFQEGFNEYIAKTYNDTIRCKLTEYTPLSEPLMVTQLEYDRTMAHYIEIMRETLLRKTSRFNSDNGFREDFYHPEYKQSLSDFINEFMVYVTPQGEEIRSLDDVYDKEERGEYREEAPALFCSCSYDFYAVHKDNEYHSLYMGLWGGTEFRKKPPVLGIEKAEQPISIDTSKWKLNKKIITETVLVENTTEVLMAMSKLIKTMEHPKSENDIWTAAKAYRSTCENLIQNKSV